MRVKRRKFLPLFITNFLSVMNDNFLKTLAAFICVTWVGKEFESTVVTIASGALVVPYLFFSPLAGSLAKTHSKRKIVVRAKYTELLIMAVATIGFLIHSVVIVLFSIFLMGFQSSLFSPSKYGLIRDIGGEKGLSYGSGAMETFAFIGILSGTILASFVSETLTIPLISLMLFAIAALGVVAALGIKAKESEPLKESNETLNPVKFVKDMFIKAKTFNGLNFIVLGLSVFWLIGSMIQMILIIYCRRELGMSDFQTGIIMSMAAIGIGAGCFAAGLLSRQRIELGLVPFGGVAAGVMFLIIYFSTVGGVLFGIVIFVTAFCSGFFKVPLDAWIQGNVKGRELGDMLAYSNMIQFLFMLFASVLFWLISIFGNTKFMFLFLGVLILSITLILYVNIEEVRDRVKDLIKRGK